MGETVEQLRIRLLEEQNWFLLAQSEREQEAWLKLYDQVTALQNVLSNMALNSVGINQGEHYSMDDRGVKIDVADFDGSTFDPETYLE